MGGVSVEGGGGGGRKSVDSNVNMVPMIDLLISVIAFLLMTAVWVQTGALQASQPRGAPTPDSQPQEQPQEQLKIFITASELRVGTTAADTQTFTGPVNVQGADADTQQAALFEQLRNKLATLHRSNAQQREVWLQPESGVQYNAIVKVMDTVYSVWGENKGQQSFSDVVTIRFL